jgi:uncharacterized protein
MRLIASEAALDLLVALGQADEARLITLSRAADMGLSSAQRALEVLVADGLARRTSDGRYRAVDTPTSRAALEIALHARPADQLARIIGAANDGVELIGRTSSQLIVVSGRHADVAQRLAARRALTVLGERQGCELVERQHDDLRAYRADFAQERTALAGGSVISGDLDAAYPPIPRRGANGRPLGRLNPALGVPPAKRLREVSRRHGVRRLQVFGSAVRDDFRPDSDVDVAVDLEPGTPRRVLSELELQLERLFDRDVDVVLRDLLRESVRTEVDEHGVSLVG